METSSFCDAAIAALMTLTKSSIRCELDTLHEDQKQFQQLDEKAKKDFRNKLAAFVTAGINGKSKESLFNYLSVSARATEIFAKVVSRIVIEVSPPAKLKTSSSELQIDVNESTSTLTAIVKFASVQEGKTAEGWGPKVDTIMGLCALTDSYIEKVKLALAQTNAETAAVIPGLSVEVDWTFIEDLNYKKLAEDVKSKTIATVATAIKSGLLDRAAGLARHLARSARATQLFFTYVKSIQLWVSADNKAKAPFELTEVGDSCLRISIRMNGLEQSGGWGPAVDERFSLQVVDEEGMKAVRLAAIPYASALPSGTRLDFDYSSLLSSDKWKKTKPEEKQAVYTSLCKKTLAAGINDRKEGLVPYLARSSRARTLFTQKVGVIRIRLELGGAQKPILQDGGVLVFPVLITALDGAQPWGPIVDSVLGLRVEDEEAMRKAQAAADKTGCAGLPIKLDWSFMDEPALARSAVDKRLAQISAFLSFVQTGIGGKQGLGALGSTLTSAVDALIVRVSATVKGRSLSELRLGSDRILEATIKASALTSASSQPESWQPLYTAMKPDPGTAAPFILYYLLIDGDPNASCSVDPAPELPNPLLDDVDHSNAVTSVSSIIAPASSGTPIPSRDPTPVVKAIPVAKAPELPTPKLIPKTAQTQQPVHHPVPSNVPHDFGCPVVFQQIEEAIGALNKSLGCHAVVDIDWSFMNSSAFGTLPDPQKKVVITNINQRMVAPLVKDLTKIGKSHNLYVDIVKHLKMIRFRYEPAESIIDMTSGKSGKTHYSVILTHDGTLLEIGCNFSQHMTGIIPVLEGKLQVAFGVQLGIVLEEMRSILSKRGSAAKIECFLDAASFCEHPNFLKEPINTDSIAWWLQVSKEADQALDRLLKAIEASCKDPIFSESFKNRFSSILLQIDPKNTVRDSLAPPTWALVEDASQFQLIFKYNLTDGVQAAQAATGKLAALVDVRLAQAISAAKKDAVEQIVKFKTSLPGVDMLLTDFFSTPEFQALSVDKAIAGCQALKPWLAGIHRQLGLIIARNAAVVKAKTKAIHFGLDPSNSIRGGVDADVSLDSDGILKIVQNMVSAAKPDPTVSQRIDGILDVTMANVSGEVVAEMKARSSALSTSLRMPGLVVNMDFSFENDPAFSELPPQTKQSKVKRMRNHLESILDSLVKYGGPACVGLKSVVLVPDTTNSVNDPFTGATDADHFKCVLDAEGLLRVLVNLESIDKGLGRSAHKVEQQLALHRARQTPGYKGVEYFDWDSLQFPRLLNDTVLTHFELSLTHCKDVVRSWNAAVEMSRSGSPPGAKALAPITKNYVRMDHDQKEPWVTLHPDSSTLLLSLSFPYVRDRLPLTVVEWKEALEWTLGSTVEVEKYHTLERIAKAEATLKNGFGQPVAVSLDWRTYVDTAEYLKLGAELARNNIRKYSIDLLNAVVDGTIKISKHPVGIKALKARIKSYHFSYGPRVDVTQRLKQPCKVVVEPAGRVLITLRDMEASCHVDYKARIEFEMDIICAVAEYDASARREVVSNMLSKIPVTHNPQFQQTDEFRFEVDIALQPKVVDAVVAGIPEHVWASRKDGLLSVWDRAAAKVKGVRINVVVNNSMLNVHGRLAIVDSNILELTYDLGVILQFQSSLNWRPRIADVVGILDNIAHEEANAKLAQNTKTLNLFPVEIDWKSFSSAQQWLVCPAADRYERMHNFGGEVARQVLLGYWGLPGLAFFGKVKNELLQRVKLVQLAVDPAAPASSTYRTDLLGTTLRITLSLEELKTNKSLVGCREKVEKTMNLRGLVEQCAIEEIEAGSVAPVASSIKKPVKIIWSSFMHNEDYLSFRDYVAYLRYVGLMVSPLLLGYDTAPEGIPWMIARDREAAEFFHPITLIEIAVDGNCKTHPPQIRFVNGNMNCIVNGKTMTITVRRDWKEIPSEYNGVAIPPDDLQTHNGCGSVVEFVLAPGVCKTEELNRIEAYRLKLIENETERRNNVVANWEYQCARNVEIYNTDMRNYVRRPDYYRVPQRIIDPPRPNFVDINSIDWRNLAEQETMYKIAAKIALHRQPEPDPSTPAFTEQMCTRWTKAKEVSLGGEDKRPADVSAGNLKGQSTYSK